MKSEKFAAATKKLQFFNFSILQVLLGLGVQSRLVRVGDELAEQPLFQLSFCPFRILSECAAQGFQLSLAEGAGQLLGHRGRFL